MWLRIDHRQLFSLMLAGLLGLAWLTLAVWSLSPYEPYLSHEVLDELHWSFSREYLGLLLIFLLGWIVMSSAMMLPTSLPLVLLFRQLVQWRADRRRLLLLLLGGYLGVWLSFGVLAHLGDLALHAVVERSAWLDSNSWVISAAVLAQAGLYQFSGLKYHCLERCRSPRSFIIEHWGHGSAAAAAWHLGLRHGLFCLGCCWSLMLLMFALACGNLLWMLVLGAAMAAEKNLPWGRRLSAPLGWLLLGCSLAMLAAGYTGVLRP